MERRFWISITRKQMTKLEKHRFHAGWTPLNLSSYFNFYSKSMRSLSHSLTLSQWNKESTHMRTGQQLLHDVSVIDLSTSAKAILLILKLLIFFYLDSYKLWLLGAVFLETYFIKRYYSSWQKPLPHEIKQITWIGQCTGNNYF